MPMKRPSWVLQHHVVGAVEKTMLETLGPSADALAGPWSDLERAKMADAGIDVGSLPVLEDLMREQGWSLEFETEDEQIQILVSGVRTVARMVAVRSLEDEHERNVLEDLVVDRLYGHVESHVGAWACETLFGEVQLQTTEAEAWTWLPDVVRRQVTEETATGHTQRQWLRMRAVLGRVVDVLPKWN